jgi:hypothetical protein
VRLQTVHDLVEVALEKVGVGVQRDDRAAMPELLLDGF